MQGEYSWLLKEYFLFCFKGTFRFFQCYVWLSNTIFYCLPVVRVCKGVSRKTTSSLCRLNVENSMSTTKTTSLLVMSAVQKSKENNNLWNVFSGYPSPNYMTGSLFMTLEAGLILVRTPFWNVAIYHKHIWICVHLGKGWLIPLPGGKQGVSSCFGKYNRQY